MSLRGAARAKERVRRGNLVTKHVEQALATRLPRYARNDISLKLRPPFMSLRGAARAKEGTRRGNLVVMHIEQALATRLPRYTRNDIFLKTAPPNYVIARSSTGKGRDATWQSRRHAYRTGIGYEIAALRSQ